MTQVNSSLTCLVLAIGLGAAACSGDDITVPSTAGTVEITASTTGTEPDADGYSVQVDAGAAQAIEPTGTVRLPELTPGDHMIGLTGVAANCSVTGENPRVVSVAAGEMASVSFEVTCAPSSGGLQVSTTTTGAAADADGYSISVDGTDAGTIGPSGSVSVSTLTAGDHLVGLTGVAANCQVEGENPRTVTVAAGQSRTVAFSLTCGAPPANAGTLRITTATSGPDPDANGYRVAVDGGKPQPIGASASSSVANLAAGSHRVRLSDVAKNCALQGDNPRSISVPAGGTAEVSFAVTCSASTGSLKVTVSTTGDQPDADGYSVSVDKGASQPIAANGEVTIQGLAAGSHKAELSGLAANCKVTGPNPASVKVTAGSLAELAFAVVCQVPSTSGYQMMELDFIPAVINRDGHVAGVKGNHAVLWRNGRLTDLGVLGGTSFGVTGLNNQDVVVGYYTSPENGNALHGFLWDGTMHDFGGDFVPFGGVNDAREMVGYTPRGTEFRGPTGTVAIDCSPGGINNLGQTTGAYFYDPANGVRHACIWQGTLVDVPVDVEEGSTSDINEQGAIVGFFDDGLTHDAFWWQRGTLTKLPSLGGSAYAEAINNGGVIVGSSDEERHFDDYPSHPVVWQNAKIVSLANEFGAAFDINDKGQIVGILSTDRSDGSWRGVLWTPQ